jgi:hypothetical protein
MTTLSQANSQWNNRPADERYPSIEAMHERAVAKRHRQKQSAIIKTRELTASALDGNIVINGRVSQANVTNWSFGQLAQKAKAPASYLSTLPVELAAECLNNGLRNAEGDTRLLLDVGSDGLPTIEAATSERYDRIFNAEITQRLLDLKHSGQGWQEAPAAFDGSRGQYMGDRDMFSFFVDNDRRIFEEKDGGMSRGFFAWNSEVGAKTFGVTTFYYKYICGNHYVWGANEVKEFRIKHIGDAAARGFHNLRAMLINYANSSAQTDILKIQSAMNYDLGSNRDEVLDRVLGLRVPAITQKVAAAAYDRAVEHSDWYGSPRSAWGYASGLTEIARDLPNADARDQLDRASGKLLEVAF